MDIEHCNIIDGCAQKGSGEKIWAINAATGEPMEPDFASASDQDLERACNLARDAAPIYRETSPETRASFLERIAENILGLGETLIERCVAETGLPRGRIEGEVGRTVGQLRLFASVVRDGAFLDARVDPAQPDRKPLRRPDLRLRNVAVGPVAVFSASNFPLAFSVAGGDTASALAAGCPVIVKGHSAHPGTSQLVGSAVAGAVKECGLPSGVFALIFGAGHTIGQALVTHPAIKAVGFTGSRSGGVALMQAAAARECPIPVYAEMSAINPVFLFPGALEARAEAIAADFISSLTLGAGQFCTNPGLVVAVGGPAFEAFLTATGRAISCTPAATMLTPGIRECYADGLARHRSNARIHVVAEGPQGEAQQGQAALFRTDVESFLADPRMHEEIFGAASIAVECNDQSDFDRVVNAIEGQLTIALHLDEIDHRAAARLLPAMEDKAGRLLVNGFGTGVEVTHAMVHGGPYPATSDGRSTSVGSLAIHRFLRPVSYQDLPSDLIPFAIRDGNPWGIPQRTDGTQA